MNDGRRFVILESHPMDSRITIPENQDTIQTLTRKMAKGCCDIPMVIERINCDYPQTTGPLMANTHPGSYSGQDAYNDMFPVLTYTGGVYVPPSTQATTKAQEQGTARKENLSSSY